MLLLEIPVVQEIVAKITLKNFYLRLCAYLIEDFSNWDNFQKSARHAVYVPNGVLELMPICNDEFYSFKYVNGHPNNPLTNKLNVVAFGMLADVVTGYPLMISSMTLLTAMRTAATAALASRYLAKKTSKRLAIIGCGAQSEFQILAHHALFDLTDVVYFDIDPAAMLRFADNLKNEAFSLIPADTIQAAILDADIIITATACKEKLHILEQSWLTPGQHICGIGGDAPGKTELDPEILQHAKIVVEYLPQTLKEGEIQNLGKDATSLVHAEMWEILSGLKAGRENDTEITVFDSVGFALEDFSILRLCYQLATEHRLGKTIDLIPQSLVDCKNLYGLLRNTHENTTKS